MSACLDLGGVKDVHFINSLKLQPRSSGFRLPRFTRRLRRRGRGPLLRIDRLESVHKLLRELHGNLWRWFRRTSVAGSCRTWSCCSCLCYERGWWAPRGRLTRKVVRGRSGGSYLYGGYRICHLRSLLIGQCDDGRSTWTIRWSVEH
jgi:hypothetical protein